MGNREAGRLRLLPAVKALISRRLPWWLVLALGLACVLIGAWLTVKPFDSLSVLVWLIAAAFVVSGVAEVASAESTARPWLSRIVGLGWIVAGVLVAAWPAITVTALTIAVGIALVAGGAAKVFAALSESGDERFVLATVGLASVVFGVLALSWPAVTVLVLAVVFGVRTIVFGLGQIALAMRMRRANVDGSDPAAVSARRWPTWLRMTGAAASLVVALGLLAVSVAVHRAQPGDPGPFYTAPAPLPEGPLGTIVRSEVVEGYIDGATTYRVLYTSTGYDGNRTAVSGLIFVPNGPAPAGGRKVLAYTHGTVGVASRCAPSLRPADEAPVSVEGAKAFLDAGYVIAATDYQGMGPPGPHPYLVGTSEGMNALDSVRAARNLPEAGAGSDFAVWGHSQGGHASLFTGHLAASYAPELNLVGVAAGAPVPDLIGLFRVNLDTTAGKVLISMALEMWSKVYDASLSTILTTGARPLVAEIARNCLYGPEQLLASVPAALALNLSFLERAAVGGRALEDDRDREHPQLRRPARAHVHRAGHGRPDRRALDHRGLRAEAVRRRPDGGPAPVRRREPHRHWPRRRPRRRGLAGGPLRR